MSPLSDQDLHLFHEGTHQRLFERLGAHLTAAGTSFAVWAPNARSVSVIGDFNAWDSAASPLEPRGGLWEGTVPGVGAGALYKYLVTGPDGASEAKADPFGFGFEVPPRSASIVRDLAYTWGDAAWMKTRAQKNALGAPMSIYEVHLGSWRMDDDHEPLGYRALAAPLADHIAALGFTHVELMPVMEHPFGGSWGYQPIGYFAPTHRHGTPQDFMYLVDHLHQRGIGVILDWVPARFPTDAHGLGRFDGTHLYEHEDPKKGFHPATGSYLFDYARREVRSFLLSSAIFWLDRYHADGLRIDGVTTMLYLDHARREGEWTPNVHGGRENEDGASFIAQLNEAVYAEFPDVQTIAEESTSWPMVSRPTFVGGLGFGLKWDVGWSHDMLSYLENDPLHRRFHHNELTFRSLYAFHENFVLPLSHDDVVKGKGSLLNRMPGDRWQKFANLRLLYAAMFAQPGKKLLFMGNELAQWREWSHDMGLDWHLLEEPPHEGVLKLIGDLNRLYRGEPALHVNDLEQRGFEWIEATDAETSVLGFLRRGEERDRPIVVLANFTPVVRYDYRVGLPSPGVWEEILNTDAEAYGGSGVGNLGRVEAQALAHHGRPYSAPCTLPPLAAVWLRAPEPST
jgi:1,4-alpha-glucan branching enzyme